MLMILARLVCSESFWAVVKVRSPHTGPEVCYIIKVGHGSSSSTRRSVAIAKRRRGGRIEDPCTWRGVSAYTALFVASGKGRPETCSTAG